MTDRDRETLAMPWWRETVADLDNRLVVLKVRAASNNRHCTSHRLYVHVVLFLARTGVLTLQSESDGVAVYVRAEPKAAWLGGIL